MTPRCLACVEGLSEDEYCALHPGEWGCPGEQGPDGMTAQSDGKRRPASPPSNPQVDGSTPVILLAFDAAGSVEDYDEVKQAAVVESLAAALVVRPLDVSLTIVSGSVVFIATIDIPVDQTVDQVTRTAGELLGSAADATAALGISVTSAVSVREMSRADAMQTVARITSGGDAQDRGDGRSGASLLASDLALEAEGDNDSSSSAQAYVIVTILASVGGAFVVMLLIWSLIRTDTCRSVQGHTRTRSGAGLQSRSLPAEVPMRRTPSVEVSLQADEVSMKTSAIVESSGIGQTF